MHTKFHKDAYEVEFTNADAQAFTEGTGAPEGLVRGRGSFVFDTKTGDIVDATGAAKGRAEIEWLAFSQDAQEFGREQLSQIGVEVNPYDFGAHMPELGATKNPTPRISRTRGVKTMKGPYPASKGYGAWIRHHGSLGKGFLTTMTAAQRKAALRRCVDEHGYRSCLGKIMALERARTGPRGTGKGVGVKYAAKLRAARDYLRNTYGGPGSFGSRSRAGAIAVANPPSGIDTAEYPKSWTALGAFVGATLATLPGAAIGSGVLMGLGSVLGGFAGSRYMAPPDRTTRASLGGAIGGIFTPFGAAIGGAIGAADADTRSANPTSTEHGHAATQYLRQSSVALERSRAAVESAYRHPTPRHQQQACHALAESRRYAFLATHEAQNSDLDAGAAAEVFSTAAQIDAMARQLQSMVMCVAAQA